MDKRFKTPEQRLSRYRVSDSGCWEWQGAVYPGGYGHIAPLYGECQAHRASYRHHKGEIPPKTLVLHSCDNRRCINPDHLRLGNHSANNHDAYSRGRRRDVSGERNPFAKLRDEDIARILADPRTQPEIAKDYGVCRSTIGEIKRGARHAWRTANATERAKMNLR
jgi:hypothetical protein